MTPVTKLTSRKLIQVLGCKSKLVKKDIAKAIAAGQVSDNTFQERAQALMGHTRLGTWITNPKSQMLLVNGNARREKLSPLTLACGMLARSLESFEGAIALNFFCGMHCETGDDDEGVESMLAHLIHQILTSCPNFDLEFVETSKMRQEIIDHDIDALCFVFDGLIRQLSEDQIVFCLIDGITFFEYGKRKESARQAISTIINLVEECGCVFKLLITSATKSIIVYNLFSKENVLNLKAESMRRSDQGLNIRRVLEQNSRSMESLSSERRNKLHPQDEWSASDSEGDEDEEDATSRDSSTEIQAEDTQESGGNCS